jgi:peptidoglycan/LPS O-acetylase OafA/YrhL
MKDKANLDILRAFAVITVMVDHLVPSLHYHLGFSNLAVLLFTNPIGHSGVLAFFVHTSLVLMFSLGRLHATVSSVTQRFYIRRFFRIYPLALFAILLVLITHIPATTWKVTPPPGTAVIVSNILLVQNIFTKQDVLGPLWSLPYEVQMYVVLPFLFLIAIKKRGPVYLVGMIALFCALGTALAIKSGHLNMFAYIPCFLSGVLCYSLRNRIAPFISWKLWAPFVLFLITLFCLPNMRRAEPSFWTGWIFSLVLGLSINAFHDSESKWFNLAAHKIALYSYGIYLMHVPVLYFVLVTLHVRNIPLVCVLFFVLTGIASVVTFHLIEAPCMELGRRLSSGDRGPTRLDSQSVTPAP